MARAIEFGAEPLRFPIDIVRRRDHPFAQPRLRRALNRLAQRDDPIVGDERGLEPIDRGEILLDRAAKPVGERRFLGGDDRLLQRERFTLPPGRAPGPDR